MAVTRAREDALITRTGCGGYRRRILCARPSRPPLGVDCRRDPGSAHPAAGPAECPAVGKFISALRSVASSMSMEEMHEQRGLYVQRVKDAAVEMLEQNGLVLESVAITDLDQTDLQYFNPSNRFDAEGLTRIIEEIEEKRKLRNDIEQDSMIRIRTATSRPSGRRSISSARAKPPGWNSSARSRSAAPCSVPKWRASGPPAIPRPSRPRSSPARKSRRRRSPMSGRSAKPGLPLTAMFASARSSGPRRLNLLKSWPARKSRRPGS